MKTKLLLAFLAAGTIASAVDTPFFIGDDAKKRVALFDENKQVVWEYPVAMPYCMQLLKNGNLLTSTGRGVIEISPEKKEIWSFNRDNHEIYGVARIGDVTVVGDCSAGEILFVAKDKTIASAFKIQPTTSGHMSMRNITLTPQSNILVAQIGHNKVVEYNHGGKVIKEFTANNPVYRAVRLKNGNTLVGVGHYGVIEFDKDGEKIKEICGKDVSEVGTAFNTFAERLSNGNTVGGNWFGHKGTGNVLYELNKDMKPVWSFPNGQIKNASAFIPVSNETKMSFTAAGGQFDLLLKKFKPASEAVRDMQKTFGAQYPKAMADALFAAQEQVKFASESERDDAMNAYEKAKRTALLANPLLQDVSLLYVARYQYRREHHNTATIFQKGEINENKYNPPGKIKKFNLKSREVKTLVDAGATGIARDPELSADGTKIVFSMRKSQGDGYHVYEINTDGSGLQQLTSLPGVSDIDPVYLPDGKIIFGSTREPKFCMCNRHIMANLYRMDGDGANIHQIGKSTLFEGHSSVMEDGRVLYDRWEYVDRNFGDAQGLWVVNPDGTLHAIFYGNNTASPGGVIDARQIPGSQNVIAVFSSCHDRPWGALAIINRNKGVDGAQSVEHIWPASARKLIGVGSWDTFMQVRPRYEDPYPLADPETRAGAGKYFLCARTIKGNHERTGIYLIDIFGNEILVHEESDGMGCYDPMLITSRKLETARPDLRDFANANGTFYVQNVYESTHMKGVKRGEVKFLRVVESPEKRSWTRSGWSGQGTQAPALNWHSFENKRILGTVPVEADGSAYFTVPSDTFFFFQLLDQDGKMIQSMRSGTIIQSAETQGCVGCHENRVGTPPASATGLQALMRPPSPMGQGYAAGRMFNYLSDVQPVFDKHCVSCHDFGKPAGEKLNLAGDKEVVFNVSYADLWRKNVVKLAGGGPAAIQEAKSWGSHASKLTEALNGYMDVKLTSDEKQILYTWMDLNGTYYPTYDCAFPQNPAGRSPLTNSQFGRLAQLCGLNSRAMLSHRTHPGAKLSFDRPEVSPCLQHLKTGSAEYNEALSIIRQGAETLKTTPRADMPGFIPSALDQNRTERYEEFRQTENVFRKALREGRKLYDTDVQQTNRQ